MGRRRRAREFALQMLFQLDLSGGTPDDVFPEFWATQQVEDDLRRFAERLVLGVVAERDRLDALIEGATEHWRLDRMAVVERNVLRLASYEMLRDPETPPAVAIDEAIEVGRKYGGEKSDSFINGILDAVRRAIERGRAEPGPRGGAEDRGA